MTPQRLISHLHCIYNITFANGVINFSSNFRLYSLTSTLSLPFVLTEREPRPPVTITKLKVASERFGVCGDNRTLYGGCWECDVVNGNITLVTVSTCTFKHNLKITTRNSSVQDWKECRKTKLIELFSINKVSLV